MSDEIRDDSVVSDAPMGDAATGAMLGGAGGVVAGALAGAVMGPGGVLVGAVVGGVIGAAASGAAVAAVDTIDDDNHFSGLPDDMSLEDPSDREPMIIHRQMAGQIPSETPLGVGMPEITAMAGPSNMAAEDARQAMQPTDMGWERDNDVNTIGIVTGDLAPLGATDSLKKDRLADIGSGGRAYADNPGDDGEPKL